MLNEQRIISLRRVPVPKIDIRVVTETGSTNTDLLNHLNELTRPTLLVAESQTQGRGRAGRSWLSAPSASLTFSLAWKFRLSMNELSGLSLAVGWAVANTLGNHGVLTTLKWPNDLLRNGGKLGGILIEASTTTGGIWAVIGIGLNLAVPDHLEERIGQPVADARWLSQIDRNLLLATLLDNLSDTLVQFGNEGFSVFVDRWNALHAHAGKSVRIIDNDRISFEGIAAGVDTSGRLLLDTATGRAVIAAGDVSLRITEE